MTNSLDYRFWQIVDASYTRVEYAQMIARCLEDRKREALKEARARIKREERR